MSCISPAGLRSCKLETQLSNEVDKRVVTLFKNKQPRNNKQPTTTREFYFAKSNNCRKLMGEKDDKTVCVRSQQQVDKTRLMLTFAIIVKLTRTENTFTAANRRTRSVPIRLYGITTPCTRACVPRDNKSRSKHTILLRPPCWCGGRGAEGGVGWGD